MNINNLKTLIALSSTYADDSVLSWFAILLYTYYYLYSSRGRFYSNLYLSRSRSAHKNDTIAKFDDRATIDSLYKKFRLLLLMFGRVFQIQQEQTVNMTPNQSDFPSPFFLMLIFCIQSHRNLTIVFFCYYVETIFCFRNHRYVFLIRNAQNF